MAATAVQRGEIDAFDAARENPQNALDAGEFSVRNSHPFADGRGTDLLPFQKDLEHPDFIQRLMVRHQPIRHLLQDGSLLPAGEIGDNGLDGQKVGDFHSPALRRLSLLFSLLFLIWRSILSITKSMAA